MSIDAKELGKRINDQHGENPFSGVIRIVENNAVLFSGCHGYANINESIPNTVDTRFGTASGTKTFTSVAISRLVEQGALDFNTPIREILDVSLPAFNKSITIHHLLTHTSGMPDYFDEEEMDDYSLLWEENPMYKYRQPKDFLPLFQNKPMMYEPGLKWHYNNAGYILLGLIIEKIAGMPYVEYIEKNVFQYCDMSRSGFFSLDNLPQKTAFGYIEKNQALKTNIYSVPIIGGPDGGAFCTSEDIGKFWERLLHYDILKKQTVDAMLSPHAATDDGYYGYGIWIQKSKTDDSFFYYMLGEDPGVAFFSAFNIKRNLQITILGSFVNSTWDMQKAIMRFVEPP